MTKVNQSGLFPGLCILTQGERSCFFLGWLNWKDANLEAICGHVPHPVPVPAWYGAIPATVAEMEAKAGTEEVAR